MWKDIRTICCKLILLILPFFIVLPLYCRFFPFYYMDEEYAMYRQQYDYVKKESRAIKSEAEPEILILGDSRAKAAFDPNYLSQDEGRVYNLALGGTTAIEGYYTLKNYLNYHEKPKTVVLCYAPMHMMDVDTLWTRGIYFHTFGKEEFEDLVCQAQNFNNTEKILIDHYRMEFLMHQLYLPNKYVTALKKSAFVGRHSATTQKYTDMVEFSGHTFYGTAEYSDGINGEAKVSDFASSDIIAWYLQQMIELCNSRQIEVVIEQAPVNETSYGIITPEFKEHYRDFMNGLARTNVSTAIYTDFYCYPNDCFGDADHLNVRGVEVFCRQMKEKYGW